MSKKEKAYKLSRFELKDCEVHINLISISKNYLVGFLNILLPDGRWLVFKTHKSCLIPKYKDD